MSNYKIVAVFQLDEYFPNGEISKLSLLNLKTDLEKIRKDQFEPSERVRIEYNRDFTNWQVICSVQRIINEVDISNCFILITTGYSEINEVISMLADDISTDKNLINFEICNKQFFLDDQKKIKSSDLLNDRKKFLLTESKTFCMYPWIHLHAHPTGDAYPCCHAEMSEKLGNCQQQSMKEIWSGDKMKQLRNDMLNERKSTSCVRCYEKEESGFVSGRQYANKYHGHHIKRVDETQEDGTYDNFKMTYWDIRFSNLCNLSCRSCGHIFSSSWYQDQKELAGPDWAKENKPLIWAGRHETDILEQLMEHIDYVEHISFAGGEPLMMDEHYRILEELERRKRFDVALVYNTNFTKTKLKDRSVFDYWCKFDSVAVGASLDAMGPRAEYIRKGTDWVEIERNRELMIELCPNVEFCVSPTLSIQNALHLPDFHRDWVEKGLIKAHEFNINLLHDPGWLRLDIATQPYKDKIRIKIEKHLDWLRPLDKLNRATVGFESALKFLEGNNISQLPTFWERMSELDIIRGEDLLTAIPELADLRLNY
jgi:radical SAM protein with 4Fe4S-binding SPASM domain